jgi:CBS domain-containing protein
MFSVYGVGGQLFRGSLEQLRKIGGVSAIARSNAVQAVGRGGQDASSPPRTLIGPAHHQAARDEAHRSALAAYAQTEQPRLPRHPLRQVDALMSRTVITIPDASTVLEAWQILFQQEVGQAPVVDKAGALVGLLLRADLLHPDHLPRPDSNMPAWRALMAQNVASIMVTPVPSVAPETDIRHVARVLLDTGLPGLPVVDEQGLVCGFFSRSDILRAVVTDPPLDLWG